VSLEREDYHVSMLCMKLGPRSIIACTVGLLRGAWSIDARVVRKTEMR
jgi:hypothetical protein